MQPAWRILLAGSVVELSFSETAHSRWKANAWAADIAMYRKSTKVSVLQRSLFVDFLQERPFKILGLQQVAIGGLDKKVMQCFGRKTKQFVKEVASPGYALNLFVARTEEIHTRRICWTEWWNTFFHPTDTVKYAVLARCRHSTATSYHCVKNQRDRNPIVVLCCYARAHGSACYSTLCLRGSRRHSVLKRSTLYSA